MWLAISESSIGFPQWGQVNLADAFGFRFLLVLAFFFVATVPLRLGVHYRLFHSTFSSARFSFSTLESRNIIPQSDAPQLLGDLASPVPG